ncbi:MAG: outer membrane beta-barrel protein [Gemmatimonadaceae bacterium]
MLFPAYPPRASDASAHPNFPSHDRRGKNTEVDRQRGRDTRTFANIADGLSVSTFGWRVRSNVSLRVSSTQDLQALVSYQAPMTVEQGHNAARTQFSMAARQKWMQDRLSVTMRVIDPFNTSRESNTTIDPRFNQTSSRARLIRGLLLSLNWTFGNPDKEGRDTIDQGDQSPP